MERRLFSFILASTAFFLIYASLRLMLVPPRPIVPKAGVAELDDLEDADVPKSDAGDPKADDDSSIDDAIERTTKPDWRTLGSMDANSGYLMLVTINNLGSGIERIELTQRNEDGRLKYRRVDVLSGYLGYLAADETSTERGVRVNVVGPGTPAQMAVCEDSSITGGLKPGDVIVGLNKTEINNASDLYQRLEKTKPDQTITLRVVRGDAAINPETPAENGDAAIEAVEPNELTFKVELSEHPLDLVRLSGSGGLDEIRGNLSRLSCLMSVSQVGRRSLADKDDLLGDADPTRLFWDSVSSDEVADDSQSAAYEVRLSDGDLRRVNGRSLKFRRSYTLPKNSYLLDMDLSVENASDQSQSIAYRLEGVNGVTLEGWWYSNKISPNWTGSAARDVIFKTAAQGHQLVSGYGLLKNARDLTQAPGQTLFVPVAADAERQLSYIGVDAQYFAVAYVPPVDVAALDQFGRATAALAAIPNEIPKHQERAVNTSFHLDSQLVELAPGQSIDQSMRIFAGPKQPELLASVGMGESIYYGWFSWPAMWLGYLLHFLGGVGNYAVAIVLLTVIVRAAMFPLSRKAAVNAQRMQELAPELKKISEKFKDDMEGRIKAQRELQQRVGFNPMAGCLPMFLQLPIFIGLYRTLSVDIELRQAAFASWTTWSSNLAAPDMLAYWGDWMWDYMGGRGTGWLGPYFNILPMLVVALFLLQQKMFMPPATDEQTALTQKMMNYMTLFMGLFFFRVPAGLCIYFITSSLWGITERIIVKRTLPSTPHFDKAILEAVSGADVIDGKVTRRANDNGKNGSSNAIATRNGSSNGDGESWTDKLRKRLTTEEPVTAPPPKDRKRPGSGKKRK